MENLDYYGVMQAKNMQTPYSSVAQVWHFFMVFGLFARGLRHVAKRVPLPLKRDDPVKILDIGCGDGVVSFALLERFKNAEILATDADHQMVRVVEALRKKKRISKDRLATACSDANYPHMVQWGCVGSRDELPKETFDLAVASAVLEHVELERSVKHVYELLAPGGVFLIIAMRDDGILAPFYEKAYGCVARSIDEHRQVLMRAGFQSVLVEPCRWSDFSANLTRVVLVARKEEVYQATEDAVYTVPIKN